MKSTRLALLLGAIIAGSACEDSVSSPAFEALDGRMVGIIELVETEPRQVSGGTGLRLGVVAPDTVTAGVPFSATITTLGFNGCWREAGATVVNSARRAVVTPYDRIITHVDGQPVGCFQAIVNLPRSVSITFTQQGEATLRVEGRRVLASGVDNATNVAIEKRIWVR